MDGAPSRACAPLDGACSCIIPPTNNAGGAMRLRNMTLVLIVGLALVQVASAQDHWVTTWTAAPQVGRGGGPPAAAAAAGGGGQRGQAGPGAAAAAITLNDQTVRMVVHTSIGGRRARVTLTNA